MIIMQQQYGLNSRIDGEPDLYVICSLKQWYYCLAGRGRLSADFRVCLDTNVTESSQKSLPYIHFLPTRALRCPLKSVQQMCNTALLSDFLGSMYKYQRNYKHMLTHCYHAIDAIEKIEQISHLVPKSYMNALSDFAWKKSIFCADYHVRKNSLFSCLNTNSLT